MSAAPNFIIAELKSDAGQVLSVITATAKDFKTGSKGYFTSGKVEVEGKRYQVQVQMVEIGSKAAPKTEE
jgi:uncharacterized protein (DUF2141 family)